MLWKIFFHTVEKTGHFFHTMEKLSANFPHNGKTLRELFHSVENSGLGLFSGVLGCSLGAVERSTRRPLSIVERDRPKGREKWCPMQSGSALNRNRFGCGVERDHFSGREVGDFSRSQMRRGRCGRRGFHLGAVKKCQRIERPYHGRPKA